jgi:hypothetical protein
VWGEPIRQPRHRHKQKITLWVVFFFLTKHKKPHLFRCGLIFCSVYPIRGLSVENVLVFDERLLALGADNILGIHCVVKVNLAVAGRAHCAVELCFVVVAIAAAAVAIVVAIAVTAVAIVIITVTIVSTTTVITTIAIVIAVTIMSATTIIITITVVIRVTIVSTATIVITIAASITHFI